VERLKVELQAQQLPDDRFDRLVERLDLHPASSRRDSHLAPVDDAVQAAVVPDVRAVDAPEREAVERELEVVRGRHRDESHGARLAAVRGRTARWGGRPPDRVLRASPEPSRGLRHPAAQSDVRCALRLSAAESYP
jgi:hypothetical protein